MDVASLNVAEVEEIMTSCLVLAAEDTPNPKVVQGASVDGQLKVMTKPLDTIKITSLHSDSAESTTDASTCSSGLDSDSEDDVRSVRFAMHKTEYHDSVWTESDLDSLWWTKEDRKAAVATGWEEVMEQAKKPKYRIAYTTLLMHCKAVAEEENNSKAEVATVKPSTEDLQSAVDVVSRSHARGLERPSIKLFQLQKPGNPCYYWRSNPSRATSSLIALQRKLVQQAKTGKEKLLKKQYKQYSVYASTWSQLIASKNSKRPGLNLRVEV